MLLPEKRDERHDFFESYGFVNNGNDLYVRKVTPLGGTNPPPLVK
jgi:hypothetical protein